MVLAAGGPQVGTQIQAVMRMTGADGQAPVDFNKDVMVQLTGPVTAVNRVTKPYTSPDASQMTLAVGVRDGEILDTALGRIHGIFIGRGREEFKREIRNRAIYVLPLGDILGMVIPFLRGATPGTGQMGLSVADNNLVFGSIKSVEQVIRDLERKDIEGIQADEMYQWASKFLPAQAGVFLYQNNRITSAAQWAQIKKAASRPREAAESQDEEAAGPDEFQAGRPPVPRAGGTGFLASGEQLVEILGKYVDFTALPDFESVKDYYGATVGHMIGTEQGIYFEMRSVRPPSD